MLGTGAPGVAGVAGVTTAKVALAVVAGAPLIKSPAKAVPALGLPLRPLLEANTSAVATMGAAPTVMVAVVVAQFVGLSFSHSLYGMVYVPAGVPGGTETMPVAGSSAGTGCPAATPAGKTIGPLGAKIALPVAPKVGGVMPLTVSLVSTLPALVLPVAPLATVTVSGVAIIGAGSTVTVIVASLQLVGLACSHSL